MITLDRESKASKAWRQLISENPMTSEIGRFRRRFLEGGRGRGLNTAIVVLALIAYAAMLLVISSLSGQLAPSVLILVQTATFTLLAPALAYNSIAGEREKRSWDLLLAAPVTHAQIIAGKFFAALSGILATFVLFIFPTIFTAVTYREEDGFVSSNLGAHPIFSPWNALVREELISLTFAIGLVALTILFSARCRRSLMSLGIVITAVFFGLVAVPAFVSALPSWYGNTGFDTIIAYFHPFIAIYQVDQIRHGLSDGEVSLNTYGPAMFGYAQALLYLFLTATSLAWAGKTINFADGEKKFIPKKPDAAS